MRFIIINRVVLAKQNIQIVISCVSFVWLCLDFLSMGFIFAGSLSHIHMGFPKFLLEKRSRGSSPLKIDQYHSNWNQHYGGNETDYLYVLQAIRSCFIFFVALILLVLVWIRYDLNAQNISKNTRK